MARPMRSRLPARRWRQIAVIAVVVAGLAVIIVANRHILAQSLRTLAHLDWRWVLAALAAEAVSLATFGIKRTILLRAEGDPATLGSVTAITYAGNALSMAVPFAGAQLAAVYSYRQLRGRGLGSAITSWALAVSAIVSSSALALVLLAGALLGGQPAATVAGLIAALAFLLPGVAVLLALRYQAVRAWIHRVAARVLRPLHRRLHRGWTDPDALEEFLDRVASISLPGWRYAAVFGLALLNWLADCGCLACSILATGQPVPWHGLLLAYGAAAAVGSSGLSPGGFAAVEIALTAALTAAGMTVSAALAAAIAYRLMSFWLILLGGGISLLVLSRRAAADPGAPPPHPEPVTGGRDAPHLAAPRPPPGRPALGQTSPPQDTGWCGRRRDGGDVPRRPGQPPGEPDLPDHDGAGPGASCRRVLTVRGRKTGRLCRTPGGAGGAPVPDRDPGRPGLFRRRAGPPRPAHRRGTAPAPGAPALPAPPELWRPAPGYCQASR